MQQSDPAGRSLKFFPEKSQSQKDKRQPLKIHQVSQLRYRPSVYSVYSTPPLAAGPLHGGLATRQTDTAPALAS